MADLKADWRPGEDYTADAANAVAKKVNAHQAALDAGGPGGPPVTRLTDLDTDVSGSQLDAIKAKVDTVATGADVTNATNVAAVVHGATAKSTPAADDEIGIIDSESGNALKRVKWSELLAAVPPGFELHLVDVSADHVAAPGEMVRINGSDSITVTAPPTPADNDMFGVMLGGDGEVTLSGGGQLIGRDGLTEVPLSAANVHVLLSIWRYDAAAGHWLPIGENSAPSVTDIIGATPFGRALLMLADQDEALALMGAVSEVTVSELFSATWDEPTLVDVSDPQAYSFGNATSGSMPAFSLTVAADGTATVRVIGYRNDSVELDLSVTCGGVEMTPVGDMVMGNGVALNAASASFTQDFILLDAPEGTPNVVVSWLASETTDPYMAAVAMSWTGVTAYTTQVVSTGTESGTALEQTVISAPGRVIIQGFTTEPLSSNVVTGYNQTSFTAPVLLNGGPNGQAVVGVALGAASVTFAATRGSSGCDYAEVAFQLIGTVTHDSAVLLLDDTTPFGRSLIDAADAVAAKALLDVDEVDATNVGAVIHGATAKITPVSGDEVPLIDSEASNALKRITWANLVTAITAVIVDAAPATLDTLNELAAALGDDPNFATTMTNLIATKVDKTSLASRVYTTDSGGVNVLNSYTAAATANSFVRRDANSRAQFADPSAAADAATKGWVDTSLASKADVTVQGTTDILKGAALDSVVGSDMTIAPALFNDMAFFTARGGTVDITKNGSPFTWANIENAFQPNSAPASVGVADQNADQWVITLGNLGVISTFTYRALIGVMFDNGFHARDVKIEVFYSAGWTTLYDVTNSSDRIHKAYSTAQAGNAIAQIRYTLGRPANADASTGFRILSLLGIAAGSQLAMANFVPRNGGNIYGPIDYAADPTADNHLTRKLFVDNQVSTRQPKFMTGAVATAAATAAKTVTLDAPWAGHTPVAGDHFEITFTNGQTAGGPTLSINGGSAIPIQTASIQTDAGNTFVGVGMPILLVYTGSALVTIGAPRNTWPSEIAESDIVNAAHSSIGSITGRRAAHLKRNAIATAVTSSATPALNCATGDWFTISVGHNITSIGTTGTPGDLQVINLRLVGTGSYTLTFGAAWNFGFGEDAPTDIANGKTIYITGRWNSSTSKVDVLGMARD